MRKQKPMDYKILFELMKDARISDRKLAKRLGTSQPTVSRKRAFLEKEMLDGYTVVPKWDKLGYELFAITLVKTHAIHCSKEGHESVVKRGFEWLRSNPNIIMGGAIEGMDFNTFALSVHKNYSDYNEFLHTLRFDYGDLIENVQTLLVDLLAKNRLKPLHLKYLAEANVKS